MITFAIIVYRLFIANLLSSSHRGHLCLSVLITWLYLLKFHISLATLKRYKYLMITHTHRHYRAIIAKIYVMLEPRHTPFHYDRCFICMGQIMLSQHEDIIWFVYNVRWSHIHSNFPSIFINSISLRERWKIQAAAAITIWAFSPL